MAQIVFEEVISEIKKVLKKKKVRYRHLAESLELSESALKKLMTGKDASFGRLNQICDAVGVRLSDIIVALQEKDVKTFEFTDEQSEFFVHNMPTFHVFWKLVYERMGAKEFQEKFQVDDLTMTKHLVQLDRLNLIRLEAENRVRVPKVVEVTWSRSGEFVEKLYRDWSQDVLAKGLENDSKSYMSLRYLRLTDSSFADLKQALQDLEFEYVKRTAREMKLNYEETKNVQVLIVSNQHSFVPEPEK